MLSCRLTLVLCLTPEFNRLFAVSVRGCSADQPQSGNITGCPVSAAKLIGIIRPFSKL